MSQWLVRTSKNVISGPHEKDALCQMILSGELGPQDEVCESGQFWIFLHERDQLARQLGIHLPKSPKSADDETTETQTQTQTYTGGFEHRPPVPQVAVEGEATPQHSGSEHSLPSADSSQDLIPAPASAQEGPAQPATTFRPMVLGEIERPSVWRIIIWAVVIGVFFIAFWMLRVLRH